MSLIVYKCKKDSNSKKGRHCTSLASRLMKSSLFETQKYVDVPYKENKICLNSQQQYTYTKG